jgi:thiosulfate/3-mercaptopyruvate sulfurtransferase
MNRLFQFALAPAALSLLALSSCGGAQNKFEKEVETEARAVSLHRETTKGQYDIISTDELKKLIDAKKDIVIIDTMPYADSYAKEHIPGAQNFVFPIKPMDKWDESVLEGKTKKDFLDMLGPDKKKQIIIYCGFVKCTRSHNGAMFAKQFGYENVSRHPGGIFAWKGKGYATASAN